MVYRYLLSLTYDSHIAEELTQETFYQAIRSSGKYDGSCKISTWLCAIAKNVLFTYRRKYPQHEELSAIDTYPDITSSKGCLSAEDQALSSACRVELLFDSKGYYITNRMTVLVNSSSENPTGVEEWVNIAMHGEGVPCGDPYLDDQLEWTRGY